MCQRLLLKAALLFLSFILIKNQTVLSQANSTKIFETLDKVTAADFDLPKSKAIDSNSNAVIISKKGSIEFAGDKQNDAVDFIYRIDTRIKILNKKAYDLATVKIRISGEGSSNSKLDDFNASTYNLDNGKVSETRLSNADIFDEKISSSLDQKSFTMPNVKEGSIIYYSYSFTSSAIYNLPGWQFQSAEYPCLYSEFKIGIPDLARYLMIRYGVDSFYSVSADNSYTKLRMADINVGTDVHDHKWVMKDIPAFQGEDYISEPGNFLDKIEFTLAQFYNGENIRNIAKDWTTTESQLLTNKYFGGAINVDNAGNLYNTMKKVCSMDGDIMVAARQIYFYVRNNFTCIPDDDIYIQHDLYDVNKKHKGSVAELNMLLIALLRQRGIHADPVILATRSYGINPETYPVLEKLNYVICMISYAKDTIFLDASDPNIGFGKIPLECYNGHARIISGQQSGAIYLYPSAIKEPDVTSVLLVNDDKGDGESGSLESTLGYYESYDLRNSYKEKGGEKKYLQNLQTQYGPDVTITNLHLDSLKDIEEPVKINYDVDFINGFDGDIIYFNPVVKGAYKENPFKATERKFPVEFPYPIDKTYDLTMDIPNGYKVDELPKSVQATFNGSDGIFIYQIIKDEYTVQLHMQLKINRTLFAPGEYNSLRDFFTMVVKKQSEQVVFKKK